MIFLILGWFSFGCLFLLLLFVSFFPSYTVAENCLVDMSLELGFSYFKNSTYIKQSRMNSWYNVYLNLYILPENCYLLYLKQIKYDLADKI